MSILKIGESIVLTKGELANTIGEIRDIHYVNVKTSKIKAKIIKSVLVRVPSSDPIFAVDKWYGIEEVKRK